MANQQEHPWTGIIPDVVAERARIVWMWLLGVSARDISFQTGASISKVYRWIRRWQDTGTVETKTYRRKSGAHSRAHETGTVQAMHLTSLLTTESVPDTYCHSVISHLAEKYRLPTTNSFKRSVFTSHSDMNAYYKSIKSKHCSVKYLR